MDLFLQSNRTMLTDLMNTPTQSQSQLRHKILIVYSKSAGMRPPLWKPQTPQKTFNPIPQQPSSQEPPLRVNYSRMPTKQKPLLHQSRSIKKQQLIEVNLSHVPPSRLYSPPPVLVQSRQSAKQLSDQNQYMPQLRTITVGREAENDKIVRGTTRQKIAGHPSIVAHQFSQSQSMRLRGTILQKSREVEQLTSRLSTANYLVEKMTMQSRANSYYCKMITDITRMFDVEEMPLQQLKDRIEGLIEESEQNRIHQDSEITASNVYQLSQEVTRLENQLGQEGRLKALLQNRVRETSLECSKLHRQREQRDLQILSLNKQKVAFQKKIVEFSKEREELLHQLRSKYLGQGVIRSPKSKIKQTGNQLNSKDDCQQRKHQQLMNLKIIKEQLQTDLQSKTKECLLLNELHSEADQSQSKKQTQINNLLREIESLKSMKQKNQGTIQQANSQTKGYLVELEAGKRESMTKQSEYQSVNKSHQSQIRTLESIQKQLEKELDKEHQLRISAEEVSRERQTKLTQSESQIVLMEKQYLNGLGDVRKLELNVSTQIECRKRSEKASSLLETQVQNQKQTRINIQKAFEIEKNQWIRQHNIKIKMSVQPLKRRIEELEVLCRKYEGVIRELESNNSKEPGSLKDARTLAYEVNVLARSEQHSESKLAYLQKLIRQIIASQASSSDKLSLQLTSSVASFRHQERLHHQTLLAKQREIDELRMLTRQIEGELFNRASEVEQLSQKCHELNNNNVLMERQLQLTQKDVAILTQEIKRYRNKVEYYEVQEENLNNNTSHQLQSMIQSYQKQINNLQQQLMQKTRLVSEGAIHKEALTHLEDTIRDTQVRYSTNIRNLQQTYRNQVSTLKQTHRQGLNEIQQIYGRSRQQLLSKIETIRWEMGNVISLQTSQTQTLQYRVRELERELKDSVIMTERHRAEDSQDRIVRELTQKIEQYELRMQRQDEQRDTLDQLQGCNTNLRQQFQSTSGQIQRQYQENLKTIQSLNKRQLQEVTDKLKQVLAKVQLLRREIQVVGREGQQTKRRNYELNLQLITSLPQQNASKTLLLERNQAVLKLQQDLGVVTRQCETLTRQNLTKQKTAIQCLILLKNTELSSEKESLCARSTIKIHQLRLQQLSAQNQSLHSLKFFNVFGKTDNKKHANSYVNQYSVPRLSPSANISGGKSPGYYQHASTHRINSLERTFEATKTLLENNRRTSEQIKSQLPMTINTADSYATIKHFNEKLGTMSPSSTAHPGSPPTITFMPVDIGEAMSSPTVRTGNSGSPKQSDQQEKIRYLQLPIRQPKRPYDTSPQKILHSKQTKYFMQKDNLQDGRCSIQFNDPYVKLTYPQSQGRLGEGLNEHKSQGQAICSMGLINSSMSQTYYRVS